MQHVSDLIVEGISLLQAGYASDLSQQALALMAPLR